MCRSLSLFVTLLMLMACNSQTHTQNSEDHRYTNALINASSPYLLQHAHNPVNWYPWGEEALQKAQDEKKMMIISVGYAACHWCHVMEHESFEDTAVARIMNEHFISIKVDREERPDVDQIYMNAAYMVNGRGGWPLNAISLPDGRPIYAGTYFPKNDWIKVLEHFMRLYKENPQALDKAANQLTQGIQRVNASILNPLPAAFNQDSLAQFFEGMIGGMDMQKGGFDREPKFPMPNVHQFLMQYAYLTGDARAKLSVLTTLNEMAAGGIYDHVGGGFARYSTDAIWKVPHFEKMLYDNAQLLGLYSRAYQWTKDPLYKQVVYECADWLERDMADPVGGYYSSYDADSEGEEGKYYVWTAEEIDHLLGDHAAAFKDFFSVEDTGNWEGHNILFHNQSIEAIASKHNLTPEKFHSQIQDNKKTLLKVRYDRIPPGLDDKMLTSWNALMLSGFVEAYQAFGDPIFLERAQKIAAFLQKNMIQEGGRLNRNYKDGKSSINAFADDYSLSVEALVALYQVTFDQDWLFLADSLMKYAVEHFYHAESGMFYYTSDEDPALITRSKEVADNVIAGSNSSMAKGLFLLGTYLYNPDYLKMAEQMLNNVYHAAKLEGGFHANWGILLSWLSITPYEVAIVGDDYEAMRKEFTQYYLPNAFFLGGTEAGKLELLEYKKVPGVTKIYVCQNKVCQLPTETVAEALKQMR